VVRGEGGQEKSDETNEVEAKKRDACVCVCLCVCMCVCVYVCGLPTPINLMNWQFEATKANVVVPNMTAALEIKDPVRDIARIIEIRVSLHLRYSS